MSKTKASPVDLDVKAIEEDGTFSGYASVFNVIDSHKDSVAPGAFAESLKVRPAEKVRLLWSHDQRQPIGHFTEIKEDDRGLFVRGKFLLDIPQARVAHVLAKAGAIDLSIGYRTKRDRIDRKAGTRILEKIDLFEVSAVSIASNSEATIATVKATPTPHQQLVAAINAARASLSKGSK